MLIFLSLFSDVFALTFVILWRVALSFGSVLTATIDDTNGDSLTRALPTYSGSFSLNSNCDGCRVHPDPAKAYAGTWHDSSQLNGAGPVSVTLDFGGIGIDVYCILANTVPDADTTTDLVFTLDGSLQNNPFTHNADPARSDYEYGVNVFSIGGLTQGAHQLVVATNNPSGSLLLFDYAVYSYEVSDPPTTAPTQVTNTVLQTSITEITATDTETQEIPPAHTSNAAVVLNASSSPSFQFTSARNPASSATNPSSIIANLPAASVENSSISAPPAISPGSSSSSPSFAPPVAASAKRPNYVPVLAGTLIPVLLITLACVLLCWRRRALRVSANIPDTESRDSSAAALFGSQSQSIRNDQSSRHGSQSFSQSDDTSAIYARDPTREKYNADTSNYVSSSPIQNDALPAAPPSASVYTFDISPPPMYSEQRPLPPIPLSLLPPNQA